LLELLIASNSADFTLSESGQEPAPEMATMIWESMRQSIENFKRFCETGSK